MIEVVRGMVLNIGALVACPLVDWVHSTVSVARLVLMGASPFCEPIHNHPCCRDHSVSEALRRHRVSEKESHSHKMGHLFHLIIKMILC